MKRRLGLMIVIILTMLALVGNAIAAPQHMPSLTDKVKNPGRIAMDSKANVYVSDPRQGTLYIFTNKGVLKGTLNVQSAFAVAVDSSGRIYVGSEKDKSVKVFNADLSFSHSLGAGSGEVESPNSIAIDGSGRIYVVDLMSNLVKVYEANGQFAFSFGGLGSGNGLFNTPQSIAINDATGELFVSDLKKQSDNASGARIQVFDKNGNYLRSIGTFGHNQGQISAPTDITVDPGTGRLYVVDSYQGAVHVMDPVTGALSTSETLYDNSRPFVSPKGGRVARNGIVYVTSYSNKSIERYALDGYVTMDSAPASLNFTATQYGANPAGQNVSITNAGSGTLNWTASSNNPWILVDKAAGTTGPGANSTISVSVNSSTLTPGTYTGSVSIAADFGQTDTISVTFTVLPAPSVGLSNGWLNFLTSQGANPAAKSVTVTVANAASIAWSSSSDANWLSMAPASGTQTTQATVSLNIASMATGSYVGHVTLAAPGAVGDGSKLTVVVAITNSSTKITVTANVPGAAFHISGPASYSGSGATWSVNGAPAGDYTVSYDMVAGYRRPLPQTKTLAAGGTVTFDAAYTSYQDIAAKTNIVAAKTPHSADISKLQFYKNDGTFVSDLDAQRGARYGANIAVGDIDGDGIAELIVGTSADTDAAAKVRVFKADKTKLFEIVPFPDASRLNVATADFDGDGQAEVIVSPEGGSTTPGMVKVYAFDKAQNKLVPTGIDMTVHAGMFGASVAAGDTEGDQKPEIITAPGNGVGNPAEVTIWKVDTSRGIGNWTAASIRTIPLKGGKGANVAAGDINGDGKDEIIASANRDDDASGAMVVILSADGTELKKFAAFGNSSMGVHLAAADLSGDGIAEIIAGIGMARNADVEQYEGKVSVFDADGNVKNTFTAYSDGKKGVNVSVGELGL